MKPESAAIIFVDDDNDFLSPSGKLHEIVAPVLESNGVVANMNRLMRAARERGVRVIHVPVMFSPGYPELGKEPYGAFRLVRDAGAFQRGTWGAEVAEVLDTHDSDIIVDGKSSMCAFATTDLRKVLDANGIETVVVGGLLTNACVESTIRTAYDMGFEVYALTDCTATVGQEPQRAAIEVNWPMFSKPVTHRKLLELIDA